MEENKKPLPIESESDAWNIFDEFTHAEEVVREVKEIQKAEEKDIFYYIKMLSLVFLVINIILGIWVLLFFSYRYIQNTPEKKPYNFLAPICQLFLGSKDYAPGTCFSITSMVQEYRDTYNTTRKSQMEQILPLLGEKYSIENFNDSKKVKFLLDEEATRLRPLDILTAFDEIKFKFSPQDKSDIFCSSINITSNGDISISCDVYSSDWDTKIITLDEGTISFLPSGGTSISRASSFIYFLEHITDSPFTIIDKNIALNVEDVDKPPYTKKTMIQLKLKYRDTESLSF